MPIVESIKVLSNNDVYLEEDIDVESETENKTPGVAYIHNVSMTYDSTLCFKIKTYQFYQFYPSEINPSQAIISMKDKFTLVTFPTIPCEEFHYGCTPLIRAKLGNHWKHGKTFFEFLGSTNYYPSWPPNTWNSICVIMKPDRIVLYVNDALVEDSPYIFSNSVVSFRY